MRLLKQSSTAQILTFLMVDSTDHVTPKTGLSPTVVLSKAGGSFGVPAGTVSEIGDGWYKVAGNATDTGTLGSLILHASATGADPTDREYEIVAFDPQDAVRFGLSALPNASAGASGGLPLGVDASGRVDVLKVNGTAQTARDLGASVLISSGSGTGQLDVTSGVIKANLAQILGTALTETAGQIAAAFKKFFNIASPASTMDALTLVGTATNLTNAPTAGDLTAAMKTSVTTAATAATPAASNMRGTDSALLAASYTAPDNSDIAAIKAKTDNLPGSPAAVGSAMTLTSAYDAAKTALQSGGNVVATNMRGTDGALLAVDYTAPDNSDIASALSDLVTLLARTDPTTAIGLIKTVTDKLGTALQSDGASGYQFTTLALAEAPTGSGEGSDPWDEVAADHNTAGTFGAKLNAAGSAADPLANAVPGDYAAGTAGYRLGNLDPSHVTVVSPVSIDGGRISVRAGDTLAIVLNGLGDISDAAKLWFSANKEGCDDAEAALFIEKTAGLLYLARAAAADSSLGSITINDASAGDIVVALDESASKLLSGIPPTDWAVKKITNAGVAVTLTAGTPFLVAKYGVSAVS